MQNIPESPYLCREFNYRRYADVTNLKLVIQASTPQGNGWTFSQKKFGPSKNPGTVRDIRIYLNGFFFAFGFGRAGIVASTSAVR